MNLRDDQEKFDRFMQARELPPNDSGLGAESRLPDELKGYNWGALLLNMIWGLAHKVPWAWLCILPVIGWVWPFVMFVRGNEWAWKYKKWESIAEFRRVQDKWALWGLILIVATVVMSFVLAAWVNSLMGHFTSL